MYVLSLLSPFVNGSKGFCLPLRCVFLCVPTCVLQHFALHLAPKRLSFSAKTACVLHQNSLRFAPKCSAFSSILPSILLQTAQKLVQIAVLCNANSYCLHLHPPPFSIKTNFRENRFFAARWAIGEQKGHP